MRSRSGLFWKTNATVASVSGKTVLLDGFDRQTTAAFSELKRAGLKRWTVEWEIRTRP